MKKRTLSRSNRFLKQTMSFVSRDAARHKSTIKRWEWWERNRLERWEEAENENRNRSCTRIQQKVASGEPSWKKEWLDSKQERAVEDDAAEWWLQKLNEELPSSRNQEWHHLNLPLQGKLQPEESKEDQWGLVRTSLRISFIQFSSHIWSSSRLLWLSNTHN